LKFDFFIIFKTILYYSLMEPDIEVISYSSTESFGKKQPEKEFKPKQTTNYFPTIFNKSTKKRTIFGEGALPLHEITFFLYDFIEHYINEASEDENYYLSAITQSTNDQTFYHLLSLEGQKTKLNKIEKLSEQLPKLYSDLEERAFGLFLSKKNKKKEYRLDTDLSILRKTYTIYQKEKLRISDLIKTPSILVSSVEE
jgi:hypothetical protein